MRQSKAKIKNSNLYNFIDISPTIFEKTNQQTILPKFFKLTHTVEIKASPSSVWNFIYNMETNYIIWHPKDHIVFTWKTGKPFAIDSTFYSEQYMIGDVVTYKGRIVESIPYQKIAMTFSPPISFFTKRIEWIIDNKNDHTTFRALTYFRFGFVFRWLFKGFIFKLIDDHNKHVMIEGKNLKKLLEI